MTTNTFELYQTVMSDVINNIRKKFLDHDLGEDVLTDFRNSWKQKLLQTKAVSKPDDIEIQPLNMTQLKPTSKNVEKVAIDKFNITIKIPPQPATITQPKPLFIQDTRMAPARPAASLPRLLNFGGNVSYQVLSSEQLMQMFNPVPGTANGESVVQLDGPGDIYDDEFEALMNESFSSSTSGDAEANESFSSLNSEDDDDEDIDRLSNPCENTMFCIFENVVRNRTIWRFVFRNGIMRLKGKDYLFNQCNGSAKLVNLL